MSAFSFEDLLSLVQTVAIITALLITLYFSRRQLQALKVDVESRVLADINEQFHNIGQLFIERPELISTIHQSPYKPGAEIGFAYYVLYFFDHIFHMRQRGILADNEWTGWLQWMRNAFQQGTIASTWKQINMESWFDPAFQEFVRTELLPVAGTSPSVP
jgi:hypothetical protein